MDYYEIFSLISLPLGILILALLACRTLVLWYFKIPEMIARQDELIQVIKKQNSLLAAYFNLPENSLEEKKTSPSFTELRYGK